MADSDQMPKVDIVKDKPIINAATQDWMKIIEKQNLKRVQKLKTIRKRNQIAGLLLGASVLGIYAFSILSVNQETFLDDFDEPKFLPQMEESKLK